MVCPSQESGAENEIRLSVDPMDGESRCVVRFRILYSGQLLGATREKTRASLKHQIRRELHPQLRQLWATNLGLFKIANEYASEWINDHHDLATVNISEEQWRSFGLKYLGEKWQRCGREFIPLVTEQMGLYCKLDILFLRPGEPGKTIQGGDLDNRLKTLFDAFRLPANLEEAGGPASADEDGPTYCLLEDDRLISEIRIVTDNLLLLPKQTKADPNDVFLVIDVQLEAPAHSSWKGAF